MEAVSEAMEDLLAAVRELALSVSSVKATVVESHSLLQKIGAGKPHVDGALQEMSSDNTTSQPQLGRVTLNPILGLDPSTPQAHATTAAMEGGVSAVVEFGSSSVIGGLEALASSLPSVDPATDTGGWGALACRQPMATHSTRSAHHWASPTISESHANCVEDFGNLNTTLPTRCSMLCSITDKDGVQAEAMSLKPSIGDSTTRTRREPVQVQLHQGISYNHVCDSPRLWVSTTSSTSMWAWSSLIVGVSRYPPDQPRVLLDRPPPWPLWKVVTILGSCQEDHTGWLLHGLGVLIGSHVVRLVMQWDSGDQLIMHWPYSCVCRQVNIPKGYNSLPQSTLQSYTTSNALLNGSTNVQSKAAWYSRWHATVMKLQKLFLQCSASSGVHLTRGSGCHPCVEGNKFRNLTCSASGVIFKHQGASYVEFTMGSMGQESTIGKRIQSKVASPCLNALLGTDRLSYAVKYARSKTDQLLVWFWHSSWWIPFLKLGAAITCDCMDTSAQLTPAYQLSLLEEFTLVARREYWLVPINEVIYQLSLQIGRVDPSWLESSCFCEPGRSWCFVQRLGVLAEYYATIADACCRLDYDTRETQVSLVIYIVWKLPCNTLHLHQLFHTYSDELVALGGDFEYYVSQDSIQKPNVMVGIWVYEINNTVTTQPMIRSVHEKNQFVIGKPCRGNDLVCEEIWVEDHYAPWDPGGHDFQAVWHRLEGKPDVKEGRMSRPNVVLPWAVTF